MVRPLVYFTALRGLDRGKMLSMLEAPPVTSTMKMNRSKVVCLLHLHLKNWKVPSYKQIVIDLVLHRPCHHVLASTFPHRQRRLLNYKWLPSSFHEFRCKPGLRAKLSQVQNERLFGPDRLAKDLIELSPPTVRHGAQGHVICPLGHWRC